MAAIKQIIDKINSITSDTVDKINSMPITIPENGIFAGRTDLRPYDRNETIDKFGRELFYGTDNIHFSMDQAYLDLGINEILKRTDIASKNNENEIRRTYARGIYKTFDAISSHINAHSESAALLQGEKNLIRTSENCKHVAKNAPRTFEEALQLFWFIWTIRSELSHIHLNNPGYYMATLGRWDQHFYPFLKKDIENEKITRDEAFNLVEEIFQKMNMIGVGDTLKNIMLGGTDVNGIDQSNELSIICMEVILNNRFAEPHINVRFHQKMNETFRQKAVQLNLMGQGQGEVFNDEIIIPQLVKHGIPAEAAHNYACDGCEEIIIDRHGAILFKELEAMKALELAYFNGKENPATGNNYVQRWAKDIGPREIKTALVLDYQSGDMKNTESFDEVYQIFINQFRYQVNHVIDFMKKNIKFYKNECISSLVLAGGYLDSIETGADPFREVIDYMFFQIQSGSIPPVADALAAIKKVVFDDSFVSMDELLDALNKNFQGSELLRQKLLAAPKFGNDDDYVDNIASDISKQFCDWVHEGAKDTDAFLWPSIYSIFFLDHSAITSATSDGRHCGDPLAVHFSPVPGRAKKGPTAVLQSTAKTNLAEGLAGSPVFLTISRSLIPANKEGEFLIEAIIKTAIDLKLTILSIGINDIEEMRKACVQPELYEDLIVRVWGFNARFVDLTQEMQQHIIQRTI